MAAFTPEPTASTFDLANWLFVRLVVLALVTFYVAMVVTMLLSEVVSVAVSLAGLWIALQLWFEATRVLVETAGANGGNDDSQATADG
ncbi:hypothetical protein [Natronobacterium gregoryi]|uniref:DUF4282 domain-containing protein n=2 Tax=Natronobacterium gregoryi TaxID=44930 RepID=L0AF90_NATGS|nr:hypothetical protein [Natronobacterium gregoryi]AFZ72506.1 hypothetical protein Natgr_1284 [Natronobacterium gregoryi SP2]ELY74378.1 hypothetical protein C490_00385 [Natronobacterium gregoryi SP2]PLK21476.1 hypothetical protein CYV19_04045 [Natronobacterium gregoryi SP2]SFI76894.1 hypothetical protein SAMN05443661_10558 [Natronobacterium gregoryi]